MKYYSPRGRFAANNLKIRKQKKKKNPKEKRVRLSCDRFFFGKSILLLLYITRLLEWRN